MIIFRSVYLRLATAMFVMQRGTPVASSVTALGYPAQEVLRAVSIQSVFQIGSWGVLDCRIVPRTGFALHGWRRDLPMQLENPASAVRGFRPCQEPNKVKKPTSFAWFWLLIRFVAAGVISTHERVDPGTARAPVRHVGLRIGQPRLRQACSMLPRWARSHGAPKVAGRVWLRAES